MSYMPGYAVHHRTVAPGEAGWPPEPPPTPLEQGVFLGYQPMNAPNYHPNEATNPIRAS